jgi:hypothetical protein
MNSITIKQHFEQIVSTFEHIKTHSQVLASYPEDVATFDEKKLEIAKIVDTQEPELVLQCGKLVTELNEFFFSIQRKIFIHSSNQYVEALLKIYEEFYPEESQDLSNFFSVFDFLNINNDKNILMKGDVQGGKTKMMILTIVLYLITGYDVILVTRNKNVDVDQFINAFSSFVNRLEQEKGFTHQNLCIISKFKNTREIPLHKCLFVTKFLKREYNKVKNIIRSRDPEKTIMYIDEADSRDPEELKDQSFFQLMNIVKLNIFVSATVQDIIVANWKIKKNKIVYLSQRPNYKGINYVEFKTDIDFSTGNERDILKDIFAHINQDNDYKWAQDERVVKPKTILITWHRENAKINRFVDYLLDTNVSGIDNLCIIKFMGETNDGVTLWHNSFSQIGYGDLQVKSRFGNRVILKKNMNIKKTLLWMAMNGGIERFPNIVIIAGDMANRGVNFACYPSRPENWNDEVEGDWNSSNQNLDKQWHITHQILHKSDTTSCANVVQALRICGIHNDDIPLKVYCSSEDRDKIWKSYKLSDEIIYHLTSRIPAEENELYINNILTRVPIIKNASPSNFLARKDLKDCFDIVSKWEDGLGSSLIDSEQNEFEMWEQKEYDSEVVDYIRNLLRGNRDSNIRRFLTIVDPYRNYKREEIINMLRDVGYEQPHNMFQSIIHRTNYAKHYFEKVPDMFGYLRVRIVLQNAWEN